ncbi:MAG: phosphodiester glycosidase family protein, partial [Candidatus Hinthialibacter sp.]
HYERVLYQKPNGRPVRAHILSVTGVGSDYIFGVLGAFGVLLPPTHFSQQSGAIAVVNGSYFSKKPTRAQGLVVAHNRVLYPPHAGGSLRGAVGFSPSNVLFDWIGIDDISGFRLQSKKPGWNDCHSALGAGPMLIRKGKPRTSAEMEGFNLEQFAPRTAIGQIQDGRILLLVIDGRQPDWSEGVTLPELTEILVNRQSIDALNLDGGGSSTLVIQNQVINRPSDFALPGQPGRERSVANVIALFRKT